MSSSDGGGGVTSGDPSPPYFCHQCNDSVSISPSSFPDVVCPNCNSGFLEELETPIPNPNPNPPFVSFTPDLAAGAGGSAAPIPLVFPGAGGPGTLSLDDLTALFGNHGDATAAADPIALIQNYVQTVRAGGADAQFTVENSGAGQTIGGTARATFRIPVTANFTHGDYFFGPGIEELIQQLTENDLGPQGTPPASKTAVEGLPDITVTEELLASDNSQCAVCKDTFELGKMVKQMPCKHIYHADCILPWLERHSSCPVCRYVLPTDDPDYEEWRSRRSGRPQANRNVFAWPSGSADSSSGGGGGGDNMQPMMDRRLFRMPGGSAVPFSGSGGGGEGDGGGGGEGGGEGDGRGGSGDNMQPMVDRRVFSVPGGPADSSGGGGGSSGDNMLRVGGNMPPILVESRMLRLSLPSFQQLASTLTGATILGNNNNNNNTTSGNNSGQSNSESRGNQNFESETRQEDLD